MPSILLGNVFFCDCILWYSWEVAQFSFVFSHVYLVHGFVCKHPHIFNSHVVVVQLAKYMHLQLRRYFYSLPFTATPSILAISCLMSYYFFMSCVTSSLLCGQPCLLYGLMCRCVSWAVVSYMSCMDLHNDRSIVLLIVLAFMFRSHIYLCSLHTSGSITNLQYTAWAWCI